MYEDRLELIYQYWSVKGGPWDAVVISPGESGPSVEINGLIESPRVYHGRAQWLRNLRDRLYIANHPIPYDVACRSNKFGYPVIMIDDPKLAAAYYADKRDEEFLLAIKAASRKKAEIMKRPRVPGGCAGSSLTLKRGIS